MKRVVAAVMTALVLVGCGGGGGGGDVLPTVDPIDRYVGKWLRCDAVGSFALSWNGLDGDQDGRQHR
jgi:hypothetical protein